MRCSDWLRSAYPFLILPIIGLIFVRLSAAVLLVFAVTTALVIASGGGQQAFAQTQWRGDVSVEWFLFNHTGQQGQASSDLSLSFNPEWSYNGSQFYILAQPFLRWDQRDSERTHGDIRELSFNYYADNTEWRVGIKKVFWGVTESRHLVDIVNQTDAVEGADGEEKLGQPMINVSYDSAWGIWDVFVLLGFRERTFPGEGGRFRGGPAVMTDTALYESGAEDEHIDVALRWEQSVGLAEVGVSYFEGTARDPQVRFVDDELRAYYPQTERV